MKVLFLLLLPLVLSVPTWPLVSNAIPTKRVRFFNWTSDATQIFVNNTDMGPLKRSVFNIVILCIDRIPAAIHLVPESLANECTNINGTYIGTCPSPTELITIKLENYDVGTYVFTTYSNKTDDGTDESEGGLCSDGLKFKVVLTDEGSVDAPSFDSSKPLTLTKEQSAEIERKKAELKLGLVNRISEEYVKSHNMNETAPLFDASALDDSATLPPFKYNSSSSSSHLSSSSSPSSSLSTVACVLLWLSGIALIVLAVTGVVMYKRGYSIEAIRSNYIRMKDLITSDNS